jgi:Family of unknown function (DUF5684)
VYGGDIRTDDLLIAAALATAITFFLLAVPTLAGLWKVFEKAGQPGWAALVPVYQLVVLHRIAGHPGWWGLVCFIPCVYVVLGVLVCLDLAKRFGQSPLVGIGLLVAPFVGFPLLGFGGAKYELPPVEVRPAE